MANGLLVNHQSFLKPPAKTNSELRYLYELLYPWLINCLHRADSLLAEHIETQEREKARSVTKWRTSVNVEKEGQEMKEHLPFEIGRSCFIFIAGQERVKRKRRQVPRNQS